MTPERIFSETAGQKALAALNEIIGDEQQAVRAISFLVAEGLEVGKKVRFVKDKYGALHFFLPNASNEITEIVFKKYSPEE